VRNIAAHLYRNAPAESKMEKQEVDREKRWWTRGARTSRHIYFYPTNNVPGVILFAFIVLLGCAALAVAVVRSTHSRHLDSQNAVLGGVGIFCIVLGAAQISRLIRNPDA